MAALRTLVFIDGHALLLTGVGYRYRPWCGKLHIVRDFQHERIIAVFAWLFTLPVLLLGIMLLLTMAGFVVLGVERQERVDFDRRLLSLMIREALARSLFAVITPWGVVSSAPVRVPVPNDVPERPPVLLVGGSSHNRAALGFLRSFLNNRGFAWVWSVDARHADRGIVQAAEQLAVDVERTCQEADVKTVDLCAFGTGGLVAAWYTRHMAPDGRVRRLVTIGCPWRGTKLSVFRRGPLADELRYDGHFLDDLVPAIPTVSVWSSTDPTVIPSESAAPDGVRSIEIDTAGHADLLLSSRVFRAVEGALT